MCYWVKVFIVTMLRVKHNNRLEYARLGGRQRPRLRSASHAQR